MSFADSNSAASPDFRELIEKARAGCAESLGLILDEVQSYLKAVATTSIDSDIHGKVSPSDLVQETMVDAHKSFGEFQGSDQRQLMAWLRRILINNLLNDYRKLRSTKKRDVSRESSNIELDGILRIDDPSPSKMASANEEHAVLAEELGRLTPHFRTVIELRHKEQLTFAEIGERIGKSSDAARMVWYRAFDQLSRAIERRLG